MLNFLKNDVTVNNFIYYPGVHFNLPEHVEIIKGIIDPSVLKLLGDIPVIIQPSPNASVAASISLLNGVVVLMICSNKLVEITTEFKSNEVFTFLNSWLIHEATHLQQIKRGDLVLHEDTPGYITWKGQFVKALQPDSIAYTKQEWEVEAIQVELQYLVDMGIVASLEEAKALFDLGAGVLFAA